MTVPSPTGDGPVTLPAPGAPSDAGVTRAAPARGAPAARATAPAARAPSWRGVLVRTAPPRGPRRRLDGGAELPFSNTFHTRRPTPSRGTEVVRAGVRAGVFEAEPLGRGAREDQARELGHEVRRQLDISGGAAVEGAWMRSRTWHIGIESQRLPTPVDAGRQAEARPVGQRVQAVQRAAGLEHVGSLVKPSSSRATRSMPDSSRSRRRIATRDTLPTSASGSAARMPSRPMTSAGGRVRRRSAARPRP